MHTLYTTPAFVLTAYPHGESSRVYKLLTRDLGMVYAHGQGVRELRNRNRYALATHAQAQVTLVRGRGTWRLTGAHTLAGPGTSAWRRVLTLAGTLLAQEDPAPRLYQLLETGRSVLKVDEASSNLVAAREAALALYVLHELGYVARPHASVVDELLASDVALEVVIERIVHRQVELVHAVNVALEVVPRQV